MKYSNVTSSLEAHPRRVAPARGCGSCRLCTSEARFQGSYRSCACRYMSAEDIADGVKLDFLPLMELETADRHCKNLSPAVLENR